MSAQDEPRSVLTLEMADRMLAEVASIDDAKQLINLAEMARVYARQSKLGTSAINHATVIKIRAESKLADIVDEGQQKGVIASPGKPPHSGELPTNLPALGVDDHRLAEARLLRDSFSDSELVARQAEADERDEVLSRQRLLTEARSQNTRNSAIQSERVSFLFPVFEALDALAAVDLPADEWAARVPAYSAYRVTDRLESAFAWLSKLKESWQCPSEQL